MNPRIVDVEVLSHYRVELTFTDDSRAVVDLAPLLANRDGVFRALRDPEFFARVDVDRDAGTIVWPNGADIDPDALYEAANAERA